jgi:hypothetical protein
MRFMVYYYERRSLARRNWSGSGAPATYGDLGSEQYGQREMARRAGPGPRRPPQVEEYSPFRPEERFSDEIQEEYGPDWGYGRGPDLDTTDFGEYYTGPGGRGYGDIKGYTSRRYDRGYGTVPRGDKAYDYGLTGFGSRYQPFYGGRGYGRRAEHGMGTVDFGGRGFETGYEGRGYSRPTDEEYVHRFEPVMREDETGMSTSGYYYQTSLGSQFEADFRTEEGPYYNPEYFNTDERRVLRQQKLGRQYNGAGDVR